jgi:hypothetical protein
LTAVTVEQARRVAVRAQALDGSATDVLDVVRRLGFLQMDPIATIAPPQHLVLYSRLGSFDVAELDRLIWKERKLFEWDAFIWPIEDLPLVRARMRRRRRDRQRVDARLSPDQRPPAAPHPAQAAGGFRELRGPQASQRSLWGHRPCEEVSHRGKTCEAIGSKSGSTSHSAAVARNKNPAGAGF